MPAWSNRLQYGYTGATVNEPELMSLALAELTAGLVIDLTKSLYQTSLYAALPKAPAPSDRIVWSATLATSGASTGAVTASAVSSTFPVDTNTYKAAQSVFTLDVSGFTRKVSDLIQINAQSYALASLRGTDNAANLYLTRLRAAATRILETINNQLFTGTGTAGINGLDWYFDPANGSYAGLPHTLASYTGKVEGVDYFVKWRPLAGVYDRSAKTLTLNDGHGVSPSPTVHTLTYDNLGDMLDRWTYELRMRRRRYGVIVCNELTMQGIVAEMRNAANVSVSVQNGEVFRTELGASFPSYNGVPFLPDPLCPADTFYFIDLNAFTLYTFPYQSLPQSASGAGSFVDNGLNIIVGGLPNSTVMLQEYEVLTIPMLFLNDTAGISRLKVQP